MQTLAYFAGYILRENLLSAKSHFSIKKMQRSFRFWKLFVRIVAYCWWIFWDSNLDLLK